MIDRATQRPEKFEKPAHWSNDPAPAPQAAQGEAGKDGAGSEQSDKDESTKDGLSPTRYGDWVSKGIAIDF